MDSEETGLTEKGVIAEKKMVAEEKVVVVEWDWIQWRKRCQVERRGEGRVE